MAPSEETSSAVNAWLAEHNVSATPLTPAGDWVGFTVPVSKANELFNTEFATYRHLDSGAESVRTLAYSLPDDVSNHVAFIYPTTQFIPPANNKVQVKAIQPPAAVSKRSRSRRADIPAECAQVITPACLQAIYNIPATPATASGNSLGVSGFGGEVANPDDLTVSDSSR